MPVETAERDEFRTPVSPAGIEFAQVTCRENQTSILEGQYVTKWTPDSKKLIFLRSAGDSHGLPLSMDHSARRRIC